MARAKHRFITIRVPDKMPARDRKALADDLIEYTVERTESNKNSAGRKFPKYSKEYVNSLDAKIAGKSKNRSDVNLTLSGDMLASIKLLKQRKGYITYGFNKSDENNDKADGNITGSYGGKANKRKARPFLGFMSERERGRLKKMKANYL